jgi:DNA-binding MarR family transcriptional regulator
MCGGSSHSGTGRPPRLDGRDLARILVTNATNYKTQDIGVSEHGIEALDDLAEVADTQADEATAPGAHAADAAADAGVPISGVRRNARVSSKVSAEIGAQTAAAASETVSGAEASAGAAAIDADGVLALEHFLPYRMSVLTNTVSRAIAREYDQRFGLSIPQWRVMAVLARFPDLSAGEVADKTAMDKVQVSRAVAGLLNDGRLTRCTDTADRRRSVLRLSPAGRDIYARIVPLARRYEADLLASLPEADRQALDRIVDALTARARTFG